MEIYEFDFALSGESEDMLYSFSSSSTGIMLSTMWNQSGILNLGNNTTIRYNEYCPIDPSTNNTHSLTGCTNTAAAQIIYYFVENGLLDLQLQLTADDEYTSKYDGTVIEIKADGSTPGTLSFTEINSMIADYDITSAADAAALTYACAVVQHAGFSANATSTAWYDSLFLRSGFTCVLNAYSGRKTSYYWFTEDAKGNTIISDGGWEVLIENLTAGRVVGTSYPGHALVIDGYDAENDLFHINFGWGDSNSTKWYTKDEINAAGYYEFIYDLMVEKITDLTVTDLDLYGTGTLIRAVEQANGIAGDNNIKFTTKTDGGKLILPQKLDFSEKTQIDNFNIDLFITDSYGFRVSSGADVKFNNFTGTLIANTNYNYNAAFYVSGGLTLNADNAIIYGGNYSENDSYTAGSEKILQELKNANAGDTAPAQWLLDSAANAIRNYSSQSLVLNLTNNTLVVGDIAGSYVDDNIVITNGSKIYGDLSLSTGNNTVTIDNTSRLSGNLYGQVSITVDLIAEASNDAIISFNANAYNWYKNANITIDITDAKAGVYTLLSAEETVTDPTTISYMSFTVDAGTGEDIVLKIGSTSDSKYAELLYEDRSIKLKVHGYDPDDTIKPSVPGNFSENICGSSVILNWSEASDNNAVKGYYYRWGTTSDLSGEGTMLKQTEATLNNLANGTYYYQVCTIDVSGNLSDWSNVQSFTINYTKQPVEVYSSGVLCNYGTKVNNLTAGASNFIYVSSNGNTENIRLTSGATQRIYKGGSAVSTHISSGALLYASNGGTVLQTTVSQGGKFYVYSGATADTINLQCSGYLSMTYGASAANVNIFSGATVNGITFLDSKTVYTAVSDAFSFENAAVNSGHIAYLKNGQIGKNLIVNYGGKLTVSSGGSAEIKFNPWQGTIVSSAGANITYLASDVNVYLGGGSNGIISSGNIITSQTLSSGISALVYSNGLLSAVTANSGGKLHLAGGTVDGAVIQSGATATIYNGILSSASINSQAYVSAFGGNLKNNTVNSSGVMYLYSGATAVDTVVNSGGSAYFSGGIASRTTINGGYVYLATSAQGMDIYSGGRVVVASSGVLSSLNLNNASATVSNGGKIYGATVSSGYISIYSGGFITDAEISDGYLYFGSNASAGKITLSGYAYTTVSSGITVDILNVENFASAYIYGGTVSGGTVGSCSFIYADSSAVVENIHLTSAGILYFKDATIGSFTMERGAMVTIVGNCTSDKDITINGLLKLIPFTDGYLDMQNHTITLDLRERLVSDACMIDAWENLSNTNLAVTVSVTQASGNYELAREAKNFTGTITVNCGDLSGKLSLDSTLTLGNIEYSLCVTSSGKLELNIENNGDTVTPEISEYTPGTWSTDWSQAAKYAKENGKIIFAFYGDRTQCGFAGKMCDEFLSDPEFLEFAKENLVLLYLSPNKGGVTSVASPSSILIDPDGNKIATKAGFGANSPEAYMSWLKVMLNKSEGVYTISGTVTSNHGSSTDIDLHANSIFIGNKGLWHDAGAYNISGSPSYAFVLSGGRAENIYLDRYGSMFVLNGGKTDSVTVNSSGCLTVLSGGIAENSLLSGGYNAAMYVSAGGTANYTSVDYWGDLHVKSGGVVNSTIVNSSGSLLVSSAGVANNTIINHSKGYTDIYSGGITNNTTINSGYMTVSSGGTANATTVNSGKMYIYSGGTVSNTTINVSGRLYISSGGTALAIKENGGHVSVELGANVVFASNTINKVTLSNYASMTVHSNTVADSTTINYLGSMFIYSGGSANYTTVNSGGNMYISSGAEANYTTINSGGRMYISSGAEANYTTINLGYLYLSQGVAANYTTIASGNMYISSGGTANCTTVNSRGNMYTSSGGTANNTTVNGGYMVISSGGIHRGSLQIASGAVVSAYSGSVIDFTVADRKTSDGYLINHLSLIQGAPTYTITVSADQEFGTYKLAQGAGSFNKTITIGDGSVNYGSLTVNGEAIEYDGSTYKLVKNDGNLKLCVTVADESVSDDLDGNGLADVILVHTKQGYSGAWLTTGTSSVIKWGNLGNVNSKVELVGMGNVKGTSTNGSDIIMKIGTTVAAWVTDGGKVKSYKELYTLKSNMNMLGIGDFDGDGVTDYLLRSKTGDLGYVTGDDNAWHYIKGLGKEWKISAVGDLDGDGCDDVIIRHDAGFAGTFLTQENGTVKWASLDTLKSDMTIVGTGDFNGDGVDDVLLQNKSNGWVGAWLVENGRVDSFIGLCNNKNTIEQIADFNGDGIDDLRIRTEKGDIGVLYVNGEDNTTWKYFQSVGKEWDTSFALIS